MNNDKIRINGKGFYAVLKRRKSSYTLCVSVEN